MSHQVLDDSEGTGLDVCISPVDPAVGWAEGGAQQPVPRSCHEFPSRGLGCKAVPTLDVLSHRLTEILVYDRYLSVCHALLGIVLQGF